jgi:hypothetical protein
MNPKTPRTDKFIHDGSADLFQHVEDMADFARQLETELNASRAQNLELESALEIAVAAMPNVES